MQQATSPSKSILSPKRKRDIQESPLVDAPSQTRLRTTKLPTHSPIYGETSAGGSPRSTVAGDLQGLNLDSYNSIPQLDFSRNHEPVYEPSIRSTPTENGFIPNARLPSHRHTLNAPVTPPLTLDEFHTTTVCMSHERPMQLEVPETPRLRPVSSPTPPPSAKTSLESKPIAPLPSPIPKLWWDDSEITGHDPKDPNDDGYGINGIGFLPTPAIANARLQRRKKQVAEWKNREAKEARQKRSDRRRRRDAEAGPAGNLLVRDEGAGLLEETRKVRFLEV